MADIFLRLYSCADDKCQANSNVCYEVTMIRMHKVLCLVHTLNPRKIKYKVQLNANQVTNAMKRKKGVEDRAIYRYKHTKFEKKIRVGEVLEI